MTGVPGVSAPALRNEKGKGMNRKLPFLVQVFSLLCFQLTCAQNVPRKIPRRSSTQLLDGFGINVNLPRAPRMPWSRTWTPLFDAGVKWVRIGQYEDSSDQVNWDWVEQAPAKYAVPEGAEEAIRSLRDNRVSIEIQLQYSNTLYMEDGSKRPHRASPAPPGISPDVDPNNPLYSGPRSDEQISAFLAYVRFMVNRYKGQIDHWELWNEEDWTYWQPNTGQKEKALQYGRVLCRFADAVHSIDSADKVMFGGVAGLTVRPADAVVEFAKDALSACPGKIDIMAYHVYPADHSGAVRPPEEIDSAFGGLAFREGVRSLPGVRPDLDFWLNEWNANPEMKGSNESVQARYLSRFYLEQLAHNIRGFVWEFITATDGHEGDAWGIIKGDTQGSDAFQPRQAFFSFQNLSAVFGQTVRDPGGEDAIRPAKEYAPEQVKSYWFRDRASGRRVFAYWLSIPADPKDNLKPVMTEMTIKDKNITRPVLMDIRTGDIQQLEWVDKRKRTVMIPLKDSVMAVADARFIGWTELPRTPDGLVGERRAQQVKLQWDPSAAAVTFEVQRSDDFGPWHRVGQTAAPLAVFSERAPAARHATYRVRAISAAGRSPWSNPAWVER